MTEQKYPIGGYAPGNYHNRCCTCERSFFGDKRAVQCEPCAVADQQKYNAMTHEERAAHDRKVVEAIKEAMQRFSNPQNPKEE